MKTVSLTIDGQAVTAPDGASILEAARKAGIRVPTLCHDESIKPRGACRLCMVEIDDGCRTRLVASCVHPVADGLKVTTSNSQIQKIRRVLVELLWPASEALAKDVGITESRFRTERTDCNLCGICVRYCAEVMKNVVYFKGRGVDRHVAITPGMEGECATCQACFDLCTGGWIVNVASGAFAHDVLP